MMSYPLCRQTVTLYRKQGNEILRQVIHGCFYRYEDRLEENVRGLEFCRKFLLIVPGQTPLYLGDRVLEGEGPELTLSQWDSFLPATVPGLSQADYVAPGIWQGEVCHWEAGRK